MLFIFVTTHLSLVYEIFIGDLFSQFALKVEEIGAAQFSLLCFQFSLFITDVMLDSQQVL